LNEKGIDLIEFQCTWHKESQGGQFNKLRQAYQEAIIAGEKELAASGEMVLA
jgi:hypothetical protein